MLQTSPSIETKTSWRVASAALVVMLMAFGSAWVAAVALKDIAAEAGGARAIPSLTLPLVWLCSGAGGIVTARIANRIGTRAIVIFGAIMIAAGLGLSTLGPRAPLLIGHALLIGLVGIGSINAPLYTSVTYWFDKRRGSALALISSGTYLAGALWPPIFERVITAVGWRQTMLIYACCELIVIVPLAALLFRRPPEHASTVPVNTDVTRNARVLGWPRGVVFALMCGASILCCIPMAMPQQHFVAFCSDLGFTRSFGALMLTVLLGTAFISRQIWGAISDRIGGLATVLIGSGWQAISMTALLFTQSEAGLITIAAAFGFGFSGIIPAYVLALRELYPVSEAHWRIPMVLMFTAFGMAAGGSLAGALYDYFGYYLPAFGAGILASLLNAAIIGVLVSRSHGRRGAGVTLSAPA
jgi:MFS family permease